MLAIKQNYLDAVELLIEEEADLDIENNYSNTALMLAIEQYKDEYKTNEQNERIKDIIIKLFFKTKPINRTILTPLKRKDLIFYKKLLESNI